MDGGSAGGSGSSASAADPSEYKFERPVIRMGPRVGPQEAKQNIPVYINALNQGLGGIEEKLEGLQQAINVHGGRVVRLESLVVSLVATFVVASSQPTEADVKYPVNIICGEDYPKKPPSVDWIKEPKPNLEHIQSTQLADVLIGLKEVLVKKSESS